MATLLALCRVEKLPPDAGILAQHRPVAELHPEIAAVVGV